MKKRIICIGNMLSHPILFHTYLFIRKMIYKYLNLNFKLEQYCHHKVLDYYKHEINLYSWMYEPSRCEFIEAGSFARANIMPNDKVLDICCGDGSYTYLFYSDISLKVDAIDYDSLAITYAKKNYSKNNIEYIQGDILKYKFINNFYNMAIWTSSVAYFNTDDRKKMFHTVHSSLVENGKLFLKTPLDNDSIDNENRYNRIYKEEEFEAEFLDLFEIEHKQKTFHKIRTNLNYVLKKK